MKESFSYKRQFIVSCLVVLLFCLPVSSEEISLNLANDDTIVGLDPQEISIESFSTIKPVFTDNKITVTDDHAPDRLIVRYRDDNTESKQMKAMTMESVNNEAGTMVVEDFSDLGVSGMQIVKVSENNYKSALKTYQNDPDVLYVEPDYVISLAPDENEMLSVDEINSLATGSGYPNDPYYGYQWGLENIGQKPFYGTNDADIDAYTAWSKTTGSSSVIIAIIDTGVDYTHPDLKSNIWKNSGETINGRDDDGNGYVDDIRGWNFVSKNNDPMDDYGHGTHCAGIMAAVGNNGIGIAGVTWNCKIMPLKFLNSNGKGYISDAVSAVLYANKMGASVISNSWGGSSYSQSLHDALAASNAVIVCSAGNSGSDNDRTPEYPASYDCQNIISVASTTAKDKLSSFSNYGSSSVDLGAPGSTIYSTYTNGGYQYLSGTSMAVPAVSGVAALIKSVNPSYSAYKIRSQLLSTVDYISSLKGKTVTSGRLNAAKAVGSSVNTVTPTPTKTISPIRTLTPYPTRTVKPTVEPTSKPTVNPTPTSGPISASFYAQITKGRIPLTVQFYDTTTGNVNERVWYFGDGGMSYDKNPLHVYTKKGYFSVRLIAIGGGKMSTSYKPQYIMAYK